MKPAAIDFDTLVYILFLVLYGIYSLYKKIMKDAEKKYKQPKPGDAFPTSLPKQPRPSKPKPAASAPAKDIWKELMGEQTAQKPSRERQLYEQKKSEPVAVKPKPNVVKPKEIIASKPESDSGRFGQMKPIKPSISEHASFLPGDFSVVETKVPEEGISVLRGRIRETAISDEDYRPAWPDDFDPRTAFKYAILLERKEF
jgi:hypothetical protein